MDILRAAVIGVGYLGRIHAHKYAALEGVELVGVTDADPERAAIVGAEVNAPAVADYRALLKDVGLASVVVPTQHHYQVVRACLEAGVHVLVEKPITQTVAEADALIDLAEKRNRLLQVGHLERFNPAWVALRPHIKRPVFIEVHRLAPFNPRGTDVSVVLDLMIHDLDLVLSIVDSPLCEVRASGAMVLTEGIDIGNTRLEFENGCVANITASRVSAGTMRKMRIFQKDEYLSIDFGERRLSIARCQEDEERPIISEDVEMPPGDALLSEVRAFVEAVRNHTPVPVSGEDGRRALALALKISRLMKIH